VPGNLRRHITAAQGKPHTAFIVLLHLYMFVASDFFRVVDGIFQATDQGSSHNLIGKGRGHGSSIIGLSGLVTVRTTIPPHQAHKTGQTHQGFIALNGGQRLNYRSAKTLVRRAAPSGVVATKTDNNR